MHRGRIPRVTDQEENPLESCHDQNEEGVEQEVPPTEEELCIE